MGLVGLHGRLGHSPQGQRQRRKVVLAGSWGTAFSSTNRHRQWPGQGQAELAGDASKPQSQRRLLPHHPWWAVAIPTNGTIRHYSEDDARAAPGDKLPAPGTGLGWGRARRPLGPHPFRICSQGTTGVSHWPVPDGAEPISEVTKGHTWGSAVSPLVSGLLLKVAPTRPYLPARDSLEASVLEVTPSAGFNVVLPPPPPPPPSPFPIVFISPLIHTQAGRTHAPLVLFLQVVGGHPAFEGLHPV